MNFKIPNISDMVIGSIREIDSFLFRYGIQKKIRNPHLMIKGDNGKLEHYLKRQQSRLTRLGHNKTKVNYWRFAHLLLKRSKAFRILALRNVRPNWYKDMQLKKVKKTLMKLNGICNRPDMTFEMERHVLPKPDGGKRYINAPSLEWRLYLWM